MNDLLRIQQAIRAAPWLSSSIISAAVVGSTIPLRDLLELSPTPTKPATSEALTRLLTLTTLARITKDELMAYLHSKFQVSKLQDLPDKTVRELVEEYVQSGPLVGPTDFRREIYIVLERVDEA